MGCGGAWLPASGGAAPITLSCSEGSYCEQDYGGYGEWGSGGRRAVRYCHPRLPPFVPLISFLAHFLISFDLDFRSGSVDLDLALDD